LLETFQILTIMQSLNRTVRLASVVFFPAILLSVSIPTRPAMANEGFDDCISGLVDSGVAAEKAGVACSDALIPEDLSECVSDIRGGTPIAADDALTACYRARRPVDMASCVVDIHDEAIAAATPAQNNNSEAKSEGKVTKVAQDSPAAPPPATGEPSDLPAPSPETDTPQPSESTPTTDPESSPSLLALNSCRQSLLPERYSSCVLAVNQNVPNITPAKAMATCLSAEDFPRILFPAYTEE
jgi:hypothetical protein